MVKATPQPQPEQPKETTSKDVTPQPTEATTAELSGQSRNAFDIANAIMTQNAKDKVATISAVKQRLAEARDAFAAGEDRTKEGNAIADKAGIRLYQVRAAGLVSAEEVNAILRDVFGAKKKPDGGESKTPDGQGEAIRKRIVRMVQASEFVNGETPTGFFATMPTEAAAEIEAVIASVDSDDLSMWSAYDSFADIKRKHTDKVAMAFDPAKIAQINEALGKPDAVERLAASVALFDEYKTLSKLLRVLGEGVQAIRDAEAAEMAEDPEGEEEQAEAA